MVETMKKKLLVLIPILLLLLPTLLYAEEKVILRVLLPIGGGYTEEAQMELAREFMEKYPEVEVRMEFVGWAELWDKIISSIAAGEPPDVIYIGSRWIPALADMDAIIPLDDYITPEKYKMYPESVWNTVRYKGKIWGVVRAMSTKAMIYNAKLLEKYGILKLPETWDELLEAVKRCHHPEEGVYGYLLAGERFVSTVSQFQNFLYANGGLIVDPETGKAVINSVEGVEALEFYAELAKYSQPNPIEWRREELIELFSAGKGCFYIDHVHNLLRAVKAGIDADAFPIPRGPHAKQPTACVFITDSIAIPKLAKNKEWAWKFIEFMTSLEQQTKFDLALGFVPPMLEERKLMFFQRWYWKPYIHMIDYGVPEAAGIKDWEAVQDVILTAIQKVLLGQATAKEALDEAAARINEIQGVTG